MKTILANTYQKEKILHDLSVNSQGCTAGIQVLNIHTLLKEEKDDNVELLLALNHALKKNLSAYPIYGDMFQYPAFLQEILSFAKTCALWGIEAGSLPCDNANEAELEKILKAALDLDLAEKNVHANEKELLSALQEEDIELYPSFYTDEFHYEIYQKMLKMFPLHHENDVHPERRLCYGLNTRQEIEAIAQEICTKNQTCNIVLTNYSSQYPVVQQVFARYGIPYSAVQEKQTLHIPSVYASLCVLAYTKGPSAFLEALKNNAFVKPCSCDLMEYYAQQMIDARLPQGIAEAVAHSPYAKEASIYQRLDAACAAYNALIQDDYDLLLSSSTPQEVFTNAYTVMSRSPYLNDHDELLMGISIRSTLQNILPSLTEDMVPFLIETFSAMSVSSVQYRTDFCTITDLTHPVSQKENTYVVGCSSQCYPGFPTMKGLFDEAYVKRVTQYPTLGTRHQSYMDQLQWIEHSASHTVTYSHATNDYAGHEIELALEIESLFQKGDDHKWELAILKLPAPTHHVLDPATAKELFTNDGKITGSISTIEKWFGCPYSYFINSGLKVSDSSASSLDAAGIGTISHALLEKAVNLYKENYTSITKEQMQAVIDPYFDILCTIYPNETERIHATYTRVLDSISTSLLFLDDMEQHTSFQPHWTEHYFEYEIIPGILLHGIIDRLDIINDVYRIIDYKSSDHHLSEKEVKAGQSLQLLTYLIAAEAELDQKPLGAYYFSLKETTSKMAAATISRAKINEPELNEDTLKEEFIISRRMRGWTFMDREVELDENGAHIVSAKTIMNYDLMRECMLDLYQIFMDSVLSGNIRLEPKENACTFCSYRSICRFAGEVGKIEPLVMKEQSLKTGKETD